MSAEATVQVPASLVKNCTDLIGSVGKFAQEERAKQAAFEAQIDPTIKALVNQGVINANVQEKVAERIRNDPKHLFEILTKVAGFVVPKKLGEADTTNLDKKSKQASYDNGRQRSKADEAFEARMASVG